MKIYKKTLISIVLVILIIPLIEPQYIQSQVLSIHRIYIIMKYITYLICFSIWILNIKNYKPSTTLSLVLFFYLWIIFLTFINGEDIINAFRLILDSLVLCFIVDYFIKDFTKELIGAFSFVLSILVIINFITILMYPEGMYTNINTALGNVSTNWFLGYKNPQIRVILPAITCVLLNNYLKNVNLNLFSIFMITISIASSVLVKSGTAKVGIILFVLIISYFIFFSDFKLLTIRNVVIICLIAFCGIAIFNVQEKFSYFIINFLEKDITFTGRTKIWDRYISYLTNELFLGSGIIVSDKMFRLFGTSHPHNYLLYILLQGGIIGAFIIFTLYFKVSKKQRIFRNSNISHILLGCIIVFLIMGIVESLTECVMLYPIITIAGNIEYLYDREQIADKKVKLFSLLTNGINLKIRLKR